MSELSKEDIQKALEDFPKYWEAPDEEKIMDFQKRTLEWFGKNYLLVLSLLRRATEDSSLTIISLGGSPLHIVPSTLNIAPFKRDPQTDIYEISNVIRHMACNIQNIIDAQTQQDSHD